MAALQDDAALDLNDQNDVQIQFIVDEDFDEFGSRNPVCMVVCMYLKLT